jgi:hypothetical protein
MNVASTISVTSMLAVPSTLMGISVAGTLVFALVRLVRLWYDWKSPTGERELRKIVDALLGRAVRGGRKTVRSDDSTESRRVASADDDQGKL